MVTKAQKVRVGAFVIVAAVLLVVMLVAFGSVRFWADRDPYRVVATGSVYGLQHGAKVYFNGIHVGVVTDLVITGSNEVEIEIEIERDTPIYADTRAYLLYAGITGLKEIDLRGGSGARVPPGSTIEEGETTFDLLEGRANELAERSAALLERANRLLDNLIVLTESPHYDAILANTHRTTTNLAEASASLRAMVRENRAALKASIAAIDDAARTASRILERDIAGLAERLDGLVADNADSVRAAVADLRQASRSFKELARDLRQRPSRLLYTRPAADRKLP